METRLRVKFEYEGPVILADLIASLSAAENEFRRTINTTDTENKIDPVVHEIKSGSLYYEIGIASLFFGQIYEAMEIGNVVTDFIHKIKKSIDAFFGDGVDKKSEKLENKSDGEAKLIREFLRPLTGRSVGQLNITAARFRKKTKHSDIIAEYTFDSDQINRATANIARQLDNEILLLELPKMEASENITEWLFLWDQASRSDGKISGRTGDKGLIQDVYEKSLPVYFSKTMTGTKKRMIEGKSNPFRNGYIITGLVKKVNGEPKLYIITELHDIVEL